MSNLNKVDTFSNRLKKAMTIRNIRAVELVEKTGLSKAQISQYTNNVYEAKQKALYLLAQALNVSESWLMGYDVTMERIENSVEYQDKDISKEIEKTMKLLEEQEGLMFDGEPLDDTTKLLVKQALEMGMRYAKENNKKYIPKKYKK